MLSFVEFDKIYQGQVTRVLSHWSPEMQKEIARHCIDWDPGRFDFGNYLRKSARRYYFAYRDIQYLGQDASVCDVGGFWGAFVMTLRAIGFEQVSMTEALKYYSSAFDPLFACIKESGVDIFDWDPFEGIAALGRSFDVVTAMAILEHYPHSPKQFMENVDSILSANGILYIEVPNVAYWKKRYDLLRGVSPLPDINSIYHSRIPFVGHHHEYTMKELTSLAKLGNFTIVRENKYDYSESGYGIKEFIKRPLESSFRTIVRGFAENTSECLSISMKKHS